MESYRKIQAYVKREFGFVPKTCWIAHAKELFGLPVRRARNRAQNERPEPCPIAKFSAIKAAFVHFGMIAQGTKPLQPIGPMPTFAPPKGKEGLRPGVNLNNTADLLDLMDGADGLFEKYR